MKTALYLKMDAKEQLLISTGLRQLGIVCYYDLVVAGDKQREDLTRCTSLAFGYS